MVVKTSDVLSLQTLSRTLERTSFTHHGSECGGRSRLGRQFSHDRAHGLRDGGQRLERVQELLYQDGHVSLCVHDLRKDLDRIENVCPWITLGRIRRVPHQNADDGRYGHGPDTADLRSCDQTVRPKVSSLSRSTQRA